MASYTARPLNSKDSDTDCSLASNSAPNMFCSMGLHAATAQWLPSEQRATFPVSGKNE